MKYTYEQIAKMIDHSLLHPTMTDRELEDGCRVAAKYGVASVCIKPYAVKRAVEVLAGSGVLVGAVIGFPHGNSATESKRYETALACKDGAAEIDMVINIGKALGGDWDYVERDVNAVCDEAHAHGAKVIKVRDLGFSRCGATATAAMLDEYRRREAAEKSGTATTAPTGTLGSGQY